MFPIHRLECQIPLDSNINRTPIEKVRQTNFHFLRIFCEFTIMKVTVALLALTVLFALAASQGPRRHTYDIDQGVPSWQFGPVTLTAGPNTRGDWGAGLRIPGLVNLGGHAGLTGMLI